MGAGLAGAGPRRLEVPGGDLDEIIYYRTLDDFTRAWQKLSAGRDAIVAGGGFIGSEIAAALRPVAVGM